MGKNNISYLFIAFLLAFNFLAVNTSAINESDGLVGSGIVTPDATEIMYETETNNLQTQANEFNIDKIVYGRISTLSDVDCFKIKFSGSGQVQFRLNIPSNASYRLRLFNLSTGVELGNDLNTALGTPRNISYSVAANTYYCLVISPQNDIYDPLAYYNLQVIPTQITGLTLNMSSTSVEYGDSITVSYTKSPSANYAEITYLSSDTNIVSINSTTGSITYYSPGLVSLSANDRISSISNNKSLTVKGILIRAVNSSGTLMASAAVDGYSSNGTTLTPISSTKGIVFKGLTSGIKYGFNADLTNYARNKSDEITYNGTYHVIPITIKPKSDYETLSSPFPSYTNPTSGQRFGWRYYNGLQMHKGIDIQKPEGTIIDSISSGKVLVSDYLATTNGHYVRIHKNTGTNYYIQYMHMYERLVAKDAIVTTGTDIGKVGSTGDSTGNHLHIDISTSETPTLNSVIDPKAFF